jgi:Fic family protein
MKFLSVAQVAEKWKVSERSVRNYCAKGRIAGAFITGKTWNVPEDAALPQRISKHSERPENLLGFLRQEKESAAKGGIYHKVQIELTYNSNHMEGSRLTQEQTRFIYETNTLGEGNGQVNVDDVIETANHFRCIDYAIEQAGQCLSETFIKTLHRILKNGTSDSRKNWFAVGDYKRLPNEVGGNATAMPEEVSTRMKALLQSYNSNKEKTFEEIVAFHYEFEAIHPFQDGNGRIGRLILFKECLRCNIVPFIIDEEHKMFYYRGLQEWKRERGYLLDTCLSAQDKFKTYLDYFRIQYSK